MRSNVNFPKKQEEIIRLALELFILHGYENTNINMIMKEAKLSKGGMYHYFSSKEEILDGVIRYAQQEERADFEAGLAAAPTALDKLLFFIKGDIAIHSDYRDRFRLFKLQQRSSIVLYRLQELNVEFGAPYLCQILRQGIEEGVYRTRYPDELAAMLFSAGQTLFFRVSQSAARGAGWPCVETEVAAFVELIQRTLCIRREEDVARFEAAMLGELQDEFRKMTNSGGTIDRGGPEAP